MIGDIIDKGKDLLSGELKKTLGFDEKQISTTLETTKDTVGESLKDEVLGGNLNGILNLFNGKSETSNSNPIVDGIGKKFVANLVAKLGVSKGIAEKASGIIFPFIMKKFSSSETGKAQDGNQLVSLLGIGGGGISDILGGFLGGKKEDKNKDKDEGLLDQIGNFF